MFVFVFVKWPLLYNFGRAHRLGERMTKVEAGRRLLQINCTSSASLLILPTNEFLLSVSSIIQGCVLMVVAKLNSFILVSITIYAVYFHAHVIVDTYAERELCKY